MKLTKKRKAVMEKLEVDKLYPLQEACGLVKESSTTKFDESIEVHIRLGVDPKKADQLVRGTVSLPHGTGKSKTVLVLCSPEHEAAANEAGADFVGLDEFVTKIEKQNWMEFDVVVATPDVMPKIAKLGKILGPRNLMPNPKSGTVTNEVGPAVTDVKGGKIAFKVDKSGIIHSAIGKVSFSPEQIFENASELLQTVTRLRPTSAKGIYYKSVSMSSSMGPGLAIDTKTFN